MKEGLPIVDKCKVVILTITYNHSKYIEETLKGFAMQQTNFPFLCCVFDDASTDGEQDILRQWVENHCDADKIEVYDHPLTIILMAPDRDNPNCIYSIHLQKVNTWGNPVKTEMINHWEEHGKYIAMCEGDDYWVDPLKLQIQIDFLEQHPEYSYSCHRYYILEDTTGIIKLCPNKYFDEFESKSFFTFDKKYTFTKDWVTKTLTVIYRRSSLLEINYNHYKYRRDIHLVYELLSKGKGVCHSFIGGVFRRNNNSTYNSLNEIEKKTIDYKVYREFYYVTKDPMLRNIAIRFYLFLLVKYKKMIKIESLSELKMLLLYSPLVIYNKYIKHNNMKNKSI